MGLTHELTPIEDIIDENFGIYVVDNYDPDDIPPECAMTLDSFLRKLYQEIKHNKESIRYLVGNMGYHF